MTLLEQSIELKGLRFYAYHGAEPQERVVGAWYTVDVVMKVEVEEAIRYDTLGNTIDYADVTELIKEEMEEPSDLLEHVTGRIAERLLDNYLELDTITVTVSKEHPPVCVPSARASFTLTASNE